MYAYVCMFKVNVGLQSQDPKRPSLNSRTRAALVMTALLASIAFKLVLAGVYYTGQPEAVF